MSQNISKGCLQVLRTVFGYAGGRAVFGPRRMVIHASQKSLMGAARALERHGLVTVFAHPTVDNEWIVERAAK